MSMPLVCSSVAPMILPMPMVIILTMPLSMGARKLVCGLMRQTTARRRRLRRRACPCRPACRRACPAPPPPCCDVNRAADEALGDAVALQHLALALGGGAAVAAHGREDEGLGAQRLELGDDLLGALGDVGDAAAAAAHRDGHAGLDLGAHLGALELVDHRLADVVELRGLELLPDVHHARQRNVEPARDVDFDAIADHLVILRAV